jgi:carbon starvation protein
VQDFVILFASMRRSGKSLGQMVKEELNTAAGLIALVAILAIMIILLAVLALVVVKALAESPWGVFTVSATIPIAMFMGGYLRYGRVGKVMEASAIGVVLLLLAVWGGKVVHANADWAKIFTLKDLPLAWGIIIYGLAASVLPVWLLLAPRDYLSTFMKLGTIFALAAGIFVALPTLHMPPVTKFIDGSGLVVAGKLFPFCFITIACGAISGFHTLIASGTTPKIIPRESHARPVGYGAMCLESLVAIMAIIAACTMEPGVYFAMNVKGEAAATAAKVTALGYPVTVEHMDALAREMGEHTLFGRTGGAATLAVGMAQIFSKVTAGKWLDLWYHFAIMFEALFILTTLDAGTRVGRYILQDALGHLWKPLGDTKALGPNLLASGLIVAGWGTFLIQGVLDPLGGINSLWPLFGIANQMLAAIALCLATTIILKMAIGNQNASAPTPSSGEKVTAGQMGGSQPWLALVTLVPLVWLLSVTFTAGIQKVWHPDPRIGFNAGAAAAQTKQEVLRTNLANVAADQLPAQTREIAQLAKQVFNFRLDAFVALAFLVLVSVVVAMSMWEWISLLSRRKPAVLRESEAHWLPDYAVVEPGSKFGGGAGTAALTIALAKELSGEAQVERAKQDAAICECGHDHHQRVSRTDAEIYLETTERRFTGVRRCC